MRCKRGRERESVGPKILNVVLLVDRSAAVWKLIHANWSLFLLAVDCFAVLCCFLPFCDVWGFTSAWNAVGWNLMTGAVPPTQRHRRRQRRRRCGWTRAVAWVRLPAGIEHHCAGSSADVTSMKKPAINSFQESDTFSSAFCRYFTCTTASA